MLASLFVTIVMYMYQIIVTLGQSIKDIIVYNFVHTHSITCTHIHTMYILYHDICLPHGLTASMDGTILDVHVLYQGRI